MAPKLIAQEGLLKGKVIPLDKRKEFVIGRDPDLADVVLEDPSVSRKHLLIQTTEQGIVAKNLSLINPSLLDNAPLKDPVLLKSGQVLQMGSTHFLFTTSDENLPIFEDNELDTIFEEKHEMPTSFEFSLPPTRYMLKVLSGPNAGAEFFMEKNRTYIIGKDPMKADIVFYDRSVSQEHAQVTILDDEHIAIKDLNSRNGVFVSGIHVEEEKMGFSDVVLVGTTTFVIVDTEQEQPTIISTAPVQPKKKEKEEEVEEKKPVSAWKKVFVPTQDLIIGGFFAFIILIVGISMLMLLNGKTQEVVKTDYDHKIKEIIKYYPTLEFTFNPATQDLFLVGHITSSIEKEQLLFELERLSFIKDLEDNVVVDELVWQEMNSIFAKNSQWQSVNMHSPRPGQFVISGYLATTQEVTELMDFIQLNFNFLDHLKNEVYSEAQMTQEIETMIAQSGFYGIESTFADGTTTLQGSINATNEKEFNKLLQELRKLNGIRQVSNFVVIQKITSQDAINLGSNFTVSGVTKKQDHNVNIVINGKIYFLGDMLDGMTIVKILSDEVLLEKDGLKYKITYTL